jgi:hypothetical protein
MLNQHYSVTKSGNNTRKQCRVALGTMHNPRCNVSDEFRCIMLEEVEDVDHSDPPRLNRCEKQILTYKDVLDEKDQQYLRELERWADLSAPLPARRPP